MLLWSLQFDGLVRIVKYRIVGLEADETIFLQFAI